MIFDETRDRSNTEQGVFCLRIVENDFNIQEYFLAYMSVTEQHLNTSYLLSKISYLDLK